METISFDMLHDNTLSEHIMMCWKEGKDIHWDALALPLSLFGAESERKIMSDRKILHALQSSEWWKEAIHSLQTKFNTGKSAKEVRTEKLDSIKQIMRNLIDHTRLIHERMDVHYDLIGKEVVVRERLVKGEVKSKKTVSFAATFKNTSLMSKFKVEVDDITYVLFEENSGLAGTYMKDVRHIKALPFDFLPAAHAHVSTFGNPCYGGYLDRIAINIMRGAFYSALTDIRDFLETWTPESPHLDISRFKRYKTGSVEWTPGDEAVLYVASDMNLQEYSNDVRNKLIEFLHAMSEELDLSHQEAGYVFGVMNNRAREHLKSRYGVRNTLHELSKMKAIIREQFHRLGPFFLLGQEPTDGVCGQPLFYLMAHIEKFPLNGRVSLEQLIYLWTHVLDRTYPDNGFTIHDDSVKDATIHIIDQIHDALSDYRSRTDSLYRDSSSRMNLKLFRHVADHIGKRELTEEHLFIAKEIILSILHNGTQKALAIYGFESIDDLLNNYSPEAVRR